VLGTLSRSGHLDESSVVPAALGWITKSPASCFSAVVVGAAADELLLPASSAFLPFLIFLPEQTSTTFNIYGNRGFKKKIHTRRLRHLLVLLSGLWF